MGGRGRLDLLAPLQATAPWQTLRTAPANGALALRPEDFRIKRDKDRSERLLIFLVDASELEGLFRVLSFLGLGLALIGIGFFYNKVVFARREMR